MTRRRLAVALVVAVALMTNVASATFEDSATESGAYKTWDVAAPTISGCEFVVGTGMKVTSPVPGGADGLAVAHSGDDDVFTSGADVTPSGSGASSPVTDPSPAVGEASFPQYFATRATNGNWAGPWSTPVSAATCTSDLYKNVVTNQSPWAYWRTRETSGSTAADASGNSRDGTYSGVTLDQTPAPTPTDAAGRAITGTVSRASTPGSTLATMTAWVVWDGSSSGTLFNYDGYQVKLAAAGVSVEHTNRTVTAPAIFGDSTAHLVGVVFDTGDGQHQIFVDGHRYLTETTASGSAGSTGSVSAASVGASGRISEVAIFGRGLARYEMLAAYRAGTWWPDSASAPSAVTGLSVTGTTELATVSWTAPGTGTVCGYDVFVDDVYRGSAVATSLPITLLAPTSTVKVVAYDQFGRPSSATSTSASAISSAYADRVETDNSSTKPWGFWRLGDGAGTWAVHHEPPAAHTAQEDFDSVVSDSDPVTWLKFDETSGTTADNAGSGGSGHDGTYANGVTLDEDGPLFSPLNPTSGTSGNRAISLDGTNDAVTLGTSIMNNRRTGSFSLWFRTHATGGTSTYAIPLLGYQSATLGGTPTGTAVPALYIGTDGGLYGGIYRKPGTGNPVVRYAPQVGVIDGKWHHVSLTTKLVSGDQVESLYLDGSLVYSTTVPSGDVYTVSGAIYEQIGAAILSSAWIKTGAAGAAWYYGAVDIAHFTYHDSVEDPQAFYVAGVDPGYAGAATPAARWLELDETSGTTAAATNGADGAYSGSPTLGEAGPLSGPLNPDTDAAGNRAVSLDGINDVVKLGQPNQMDSAAPRTIGVWFRTHTTGLPSKAIPIFGYQQTDAGGTPTGYVPALYIGTDGKLRGTFWTGTGPAVTTSTETANLADGKWHHVALSSNGSAKGQWITVDGTKVASATTSSAPVKLGTYYEQIGAAYFGDGSTWPASGEGGWHYADADFAHYTYYPYANAYTTLFDAWTRGAGESVGRNAAVTSGVSGAIAVDSDTAMNVNGSAQALKLPVSPSFGGGFSFEAWLKPSISPPYTILDSTANADGASSAVGIATVDAYGGIWCLMVNGAIASCETIGSGLGTGVWSHLVLTVGSDGKTVTHYMNGVKQKTNTMATAVTSPLRTATYLARKVSNATSEPYKGDIDEVSLYSKVLTDAQIEAHYNLGRYGLRDSVVPAKPSGVTTNPSGSDVEVTWPASGSPNVTGYNIYVNGAYVASDSASPATLTGALAPQAGDLVSVTAVNVSGLESGSAMAAGLVTVPDAPAKPTLDASAVPRSSGTPWGAQIEVSWSSVPGATYYKVLRDGTTQVGTPSATTFVDSPLWSGSMYYYEVQACNAAGCSADSPASDSAVPPSLYKATIMRDSPTLFFRWGETVTHTTGYYTTAVNAANPSGDKATYRMDTSGLAAADGAKTGPLDRDVDSYAFYNYLWNYSYTFYGPKVNISNSSYSLEMWAKPTTNQTALDGDMALFSCATSSGGTTKAVTVWRMGDKNGLVPGQIIAAHGWSSTTNPLALGPVLQKGQWTHIVVTYDSSTKAAKLYLNASDDNVYEYSTPAAYSGGPCVPVWGRRVLPGYFWTNGFSDFIAESAVYPGTILSATEVKDHYCAGQPTASGC